MQAKLFEIRDRGTFSPVLAVRLDSSSEAERYLLSRSGFGNEAEDHRGYLVLMRTFGGEHETKSDPNKWRNARTMVPAHRYILTKWDELASGDVIDVEFILGETETKKISERLEAEGFNTA